MTELQEARLLGRAVRARWDVPAEMKQGVVEELYRIATEGREESARIAAGRAIVAMEAQNQKDELAEANDIQQIIQLVAAKYKIDLIASGATEGNASGDPD